MKRIFIIKIDETNFPIDLEPLTEQKIINAIAKIFDFDVQYIIEQSIEVMKISES